MPVLVEVETEVVDDVVVVVEVEVVENVVVDDAVKKSCLRQLNTRCNFSSMVSIS